MKIKRTNNDKVFEISIPNIFISSRLFCRIINKQLNKEKEIKLSRKDIKKLSRMIKKFRKEYKNYKFIEIETKNGETIAIII